MKDNGKALYQRWFNNMTRFIKNEQPVFVEGGAWCHPDDEEEVQDHLIFREKIEDRLNDRSRKNEHN